LLLVLLRRDSPLLRHESNCCRCYLPLLQS
jgi:hypothetical protein